MTRLGGEVDGEAQARADLARAVRRLEEYHTAFAVWLHEAGGDPERLSNDRFFIPADAGHHLKVIDGGKDENSPPRG